MSTVADARCECGFARRYSSQAKAEYALRRHSCERHRSLLEAATNGLTGEASVDRTPKPCLHKVAQHTHGSHVCYVHDHCRCLPCSVANCDYEAERKRRHAYGTFERDWVDPEPVRAHVRELQAAGLGWKRVAAAAGVTPSTSWKLLYGKQQPDGTRTPTRRMRADIAAALLAVPVPTLDDLGSVVSVDPTGTRRRLEALHVIGWSVQALVDHAGANRQAFDAALNYQPVQARTARTVRDLYEQLWATPRVGTDHRSRIAVARALNRAERGRWAPPAAWDDDEIDDPNAPDPAGYRAGECALPGCAEASFVRGLCHVHYDRRRRSSKPSIAAADLDDLAHLLRAGESPERAAARVGHAPVSLARAARRSGRHDVLGLLEEILTDHRRTR